MPNASNTDRVRDADRRARDHARAGRARRAGPAARSSGWPTVFPEAAAVGRFRVAHATWDGVAVHRRRHRLHGRARRRDRRARRRRRRPVGRRSSAPASCRPGSAPATRCASRPALPLHGHELGPGHHAAAGRARLGRGVGQADVPRPRRARRRARRAASPATSSASPPRAAARRAPSARCSSTARSSASVTSGNFSPVLGHGIALGLRAARRSSAGTAVAVDVRGTALPGTVVATPFVADADAVSVAPPTGSAGPASLGRPRFGRPTAWPRRLLRGAAFFAGASPSLLGRRRRGRRLRRRPAPGAAASAAARRGGHGGGRGAASARPDAASPGMRRPNSPPACSAIWASGDIRRTRSLMTSMNWPRSVGSERSTGEFSVSARRVEPGDDLVDRRRPAASTGRRPSSPCA